jgi:hypothetical protein
MTAGQLESRIAALEEQLAAATAEWLDGAGTRLALDDSGDDDDDDGPPAGMPRRIGLVLSGLARLRAARERPAARAAAPGRKPRGCRRNWTRRRPPRTRWWPGTRPLSRPGRNAPARHLVWGDVHAEHAESPAVRMDGGA